MSGSYYGFTPGGTYGGNAYPPSRPAAPAAPSYGAPTVQAYGAPTAPGYQMPYATGGQAYGYPTVGGGSGTSGYGSFPNRSEIPGQTTAYAFNPNQNDNTRPVYASPASSGFMGANSPAGSNMLSNPSNNSAAASSTTTSTGVSTYSGYEAAVYAAATNFIQSKNVGGGGGGSWMASKRGGGGGGGFGQGYGGGGGRGSFPKKAPNAPPKQIPLLYCDVCKISCAGPQTYREHLEGKNHKKKEAQAKDGTLPPAAKTRTTFRCDLCSVTCTGKDTYDAHARGAKHQKTLKLHQTMNKPIPSSEPTIIPPTQPSRAAPATSVEPKKVIAIQKMNFVGGNKLFSTGMSADSSIGVKMEEIEPTPHSNEQTQNLGMEKEIAPVGEDYVENIFENGKLISYHCKLCDCRFNDISAKEMHLKGRRHRLQFKKKVNPDLVVEVKTNPKFRRQSDERMRKDVMRMRQKDLWAMRAMYQSQMVSAPLMGPPVPLFGRSSGIRNGRRGETVDDRYVMVKHSTIYPTEDELNTTQRMVVFTEKALKNVSDRLAERAKQNADEINDEANDSEISDERTLKGVMRVGDLAKQLMLRGDWHVELVVLCSEVTTVELLKKICDLLPESFTTLTEEKLEIELVESEASIFVRYPREPRVEVQVIFTSVAVREEIETTNKSTDSDVLDKQKCLDALASLRHAKWFQARCTSLQYCSIILRILKDLRQRVPNLAPLTSWPMELLVEKVMCSSQTPPSPAEALRHFFEAVASGILLSNGPGLMDPCEKTVVDALSGMTPQQREDITASAQQIVRQIAFGHFYKVLGMEKFDDSENGLTASQRKRPRESTEDVEIADESSNGKKDKRENEVE